MTRHRSHSAAFKRQVAEEFIAGETLHAVTTGAGANYPAAYNDGAWVASPWTPDGITISRAGGDQCRWLGLVT